MNALSPQLFDINQNRLNFLELLEPLKTAVAQHALAAWDGETADDVNASLEHARSILLQVEDTAAAVGYPELGATAHHCEAQITRHLEGPYTDLAICPGEILWFIDTFVEACTSVSA